MMTDTEKKHGTMNTQWEWFDDCHGGAHYRLQDGTLETMNSEDVVDVDLHRGTCCEKHSEQCREIAAQLRKSGRPAPAREIFPCGCYAVRDDEKGVTTQYVDPKCKFDADRVGRQLSGKRGVYWIYKAMPADRKPF